MFCQKCGKENPDNAVFCNSCGAAVKEESEPVKIKHNEIIQAKIKTKRDEHEAVGQAAPFLAIFAGILFTVIGVIAMNFLVILISIVILIAGVCWNNSCDNQRKKINNEILELQAELKE